MISNCRFLLVPRESGDGNSKLDYTAAIGQSDATAYPVDLSVLAFDRSGLIRDITSILADDNANVLDLSSHTDKTSQQVMMDLSVEVVDLPTLSTIIARLEQIPNVVSVRRKA